MHHILVVNGERPAFGGCQFNHFLVSNCNSQGMTFVAAVAHEWHVRSQCFRHTGSHDVSQTAIGAVRIIDRQTKGGCIGRINIQCLAARPVSHILMPRKDSVRFSRQFVQQLIVIFRHVGSSCILVASSTRKQLIHNALCQSFVNISPQRWIIGCGEHGIDNRPLLAWRPKGFAHVTQILIWHLNGTRNKAIKGLFQNHHFLFH
mmetsp:Transcript_28216/g.46734  ORF Transcript_28216/g.46734 Transcript_28216/m.46734 type:complete len:204 (+) Transcript_28216:502-1113(+)